MNPLDLRGPEFLGFFALALAVAAVVSAIARRFRFPRHAPPEEELEEELRELHAYDLAYLAGGPKRASEAALAALVQQGALAIEGSGGIVTATAPEFTVGSDSAYRGVPVEPTRHPLEKALLQQAREATRPPRELRDAGIPAASGLREELQRHSLVLSSRRDAALWLFTKGGLWAVLVLGVAKMIVGASRGKPVVFLFFAVAVAFLIERAIPRHSFRTGRGDKALQALRETNEALKATTAADIEQLTAREAALALGLFGAGAIAGTTGAGLLASMVMPMRSPFWSSGSSEWDGSTCGASCGGGCGGGGGGCGGCGGD